MERWTVEQLAAAVDRTARAGGRSNARDEALALVERVKQELGAGASVETVAETAVRRASFGGVVRVACVKGGEVVLGVNPEVLREVCRMLTASTGAEATGVPSRAEFTFAVQELSAEEAVADEFARGESSQLSAAHAARLVVGWIREHAATTDNKSMVQMLKKQGAVKNEQFQRQFLATFFPTKPRGRRGEPRDTLVDTMLDVLEEGCEALLARGAYTRGGERPFLLDVQEGMHLLTVAAKHASSDEEAVQALRERVSKLQGAATDAARFKKLLSFRSSTASEADVAEQEAAGPEADVAEEEAAGPEADCAEEEEAGLTSHIRSVLAPESFHLLFSEAIRSIVDRLQDEGSNSVLKVLDAVLVCAVKLVASDEEGTQHAETGLLGRLKELHTDWRAARRHPAQRGAARRRSSSAAAAAGSIGWVSLLKERSSSKRKREEEAARVPAVPDSGGGEPSVQACEKGKKKVRASAREKGKKKVRAGGKAARSSRKAATRARFDSTSEEPSRAPSPTAAGGLGDSDCEGPCKAGAPKESLSEDSLVRETCPAPRGPLTLQTASD